VGVPGVLKRLLAEFVSAEMISFAREPQRLRSGRGPHGCGALQFDCEDSVA